MKNKIIIFTIFVLATLGFCSCVAPSPLYGTWYTSTGDKIIFSNEGQFKSEIADGSGVATPLYGTWQTSGNVIVLDVKDHDTGDYLGRILCPFEIDGGLLIIDWTYDAIGQGKHLTFYRNSTDTIIL